MRPVGAATTMETMTETLLSVGWALSIVALLALQLTVTKRGGWGADGAAGEAMRRRMRPLMWGTTIVGLLCLLGLFLTGDR